MILFYFILFYFILFSDLIASSGAGKADHFVQVFEETNVESALAAGIFHRKEVPIQSVKNRLKEANIPVRIE